MKNLQKFIKRAMFTDPHRPSSLALRAAKGFGTAVTRYMRLIKLGVLFTLFLLIFSAGNPIIKAASWDGVDKSVVEKIAAEHGRTAWTPFINTDQGDLLLFVFLLAGAIGGFIMGFYWRKLFNEK